MKASQYFFNTLKETPQDAELKSHQLMLRTGMIKKLASGLYTWMPLGLRVLRKIESIIRQEMNQIMAQEVLMPAVHPAELWQETGRWETFGGQLLKMQDNAGREYCFGPTHEEIITDLARQELHSYKQLPVIFYQIQSKFRDEIRPRYGVMRAREFIMKDGYSFHLNLESLEATYQIIFDAYSRIFDQMGLKFRAVEADSGAIGGAVSHEFQVLAESGEDLIFYSDQSSYAANVEQATSINPLPAVLDPHIKIERTLVDTPDIKTIAELCQALACKPEETLKTLIVAGSTDPLVALVLSGADELNEIKAAKHPLVASPLRFATPEELKAQGLYLGFIGPIQLNCPMIIDHHARAIPSFICGANQIDKHWRNATWTPDRAGEMVYDLRAVKDGDLSPDGIGRLKSCRGIEVGHIFQLGDKYSKAMKASVSSESGTEVTVLMGTYGIGVSRIVAAAIEQHHDEQGIIWPWRLAPFQLVIIPIQSKSSETVAELAAKLYQECLDLGLEVLLDDRNQRPGISFAEMDLIGIPHRLVLSDRLLAASQIEYKSRQDGSTTLIAQEDLRAWLINLAKTHRS